MNVLVLRYTLDNQELANLSLSRTSQALGSKLLCRISFLQKITFLPVECVGAAIGRPPTYRSNAFSGTVFL